MDSFKVPNLLVNQDDNLYLRLHDEWNDEKTELMSQWCDISQSYAWMHQNSSEFYQRRTNRIIIPVIILSTVTGIATATFGSIFSVQEYNYIQPYIAIGLGLISITTAIMNTIEQKFKYAQLAERHSMIGKEWQSLWRLLHVTLALRPIERTPFRYFHEKIQHMLDDLSRKRPDIHIDSINKFLKHFGNVKGLRLPAECLKMTATLATPNITTTPEEVRESYSV
jgi:hypothetical protein